MTGILGGIATDLLSAGKRAFRHNGIGLSPESRSLTQTYLNSTAGAFDGIFSAGSSGLYTLEGLQTTIKALQAGKSQSQLARHMRDPEAETVLKSQTRGTNFDDKA